MCVKTTRLPGFTLRTAQWSILLVRGTCMPAGMPSSGVHSMAPRARLLWKTGMAPFSISLPKNSPGPRVLYFARRRMTGVDEPPWIGCGASQSAATTMPKSSTFSQCRMRLTLSTRTLASSALKCRRTVSVCEAFWEMQSGTLRLQSGVLKLALVVRSRKATRCDSCRYIHA